MREHRPDFDRCVFANECLNTPPDLCLCYKEWHKSQLISENQSLKENIKLIDKSFRVTHNDLQRRWEQDQNKIMHLKNKITNYQHLMDGIEEENKTLRADKAAVLKELQKWMDNYSELKNGA